MMVKIAVIAHESIGVTVVEDVQWQAFTGRYTSNPNLPDNAISLKI
jgi:hypothetical protein